MHQRLKIGPGAFEAHLQPVTAVCYFGEVRGLLSRPATAELEEQRVEQEGVGLNGEEHQQRDEQVELGKQVEADERVELQAA